MNLYDVIKKPVVTESSVLNEAENMYLKLTPTQTFDQQAI